MNIAVRRARLQDAGTVSALNTDVQAVHAEALPSWFKPSGPETFPPRAAKALIEDPDNIVFVASIGSDPVGYVYAEIRRRNETPFTYAHELVYVHHISVRPRSRNRGVGRALLEAVRKAADNLSISVIATDVWSFNEDARAFFRRSGLTPFNVRLWNK